MPFAMMIKAQGNYYIVANQKGTINVSLKPGEYTQMIENTYQRNHLRGYTSSMSACIHMIQFEPREVEIPEDVEELKKIIDVESGFMSIGEVSGSYHGWKLTAEGAKRLDKNSIRPRLITQ